MDLHEQLVRAARREMLSQISITDRLIKQLYRRAAKAIEKQIAGAKAGSLTERWLTAYKAELDREIERLSQGVYTATVDGARRAAEARVECEREYLRRAAALAKVDDSFVSTLANVPTEALRAMIDGRLYTDGRMLSQRIWSATGRLEGNLAEIIQQGVAQKLDALTLAQQLQAYVNPSAACPVSWHTLYPDIPFDRHVDYNALRLARTAITHAHWAAEKAAAEKNPLCRGLKWNLSNSHYERQIEPSGEDVCDEYARHDEGLGEGVWPIDKLPMPHPQCLCYRTEVLPTLEEAAEILSSRADLTESERRLSAWAKGETQDEALEKDYQRWKLEKIRDLLDNSLEFATMNTDGIASAMMASPEIPDAKIYQFMLKPGAKHNRDFAEAGYLSEADGERLRADILEKCRNAPVEDIRWNAEYNQTRYIQYIYLGPEEHRFKVSWKIEPNAERPQLTTCYRKEMKK